MIVVENTKELEEKYSLNQISDDEIVRVEGGLKGKAKYAPERYQIRTSYTGRQIKQIISQMHLIEDTIPKDWSEFQKAKYIYEVLGRNISYNYNNEEYSNQQSSNLTILLSRKGICAGYSLLFKEMMDRQGIKCDYFRGKALFENGRPGEVHAWNVLEIGGNAFPVDLTWDSSNLINGCPIKYFGNDPNFWNRHAPDQDEKKYNFVWYKSEDIEKIDISKTTNRSQISENQKIDAIHLVIEETYNRFKASHGKEVASRHMQNAIKKFINEGKTESFTRNGNARDTIKKYVTPSDMLELLAKLYVRQNTELRKDSDFLVSSVISNTQKHGNEFSGNSLVEYVKYGYTGGFTKDNNARTHMQQYMTPDMAMDIIIHDIVSREINQIEKTNVINNSIIKNAKENYFDGGEFAKVNLPQEKSKNLIIKAMNWIRQKMHEKNKQNINNNNKFDKINNSKEDNFQK